MGLTSCGLSMNEPVPLMAPALEMTGDVAVFLLNPAAPDTVLILHAIVQTAAPVLYVTVWR